MAFTRQLPEWHALGVEPPQSLKEGGWKAGVKPPADYFNWLQNKAFRAIEELQLKAGEVKTINGQSPDEKGNITISVDTTYLATKEELKVKYSKPTTGIPKSDLASGVQTSLSKADGSAKQTDFEALDKKVSEHQAEDATNEKKGHVQLVDDVNGNSTSLVPSQNAVRKKVEQTEYKINKSGKDSNGIFTTVQYTRKSNNTLAVKSVLSGGTTPKYTTRTVTYYGIDGTTVESTVTKTLSYDTDGDLVGEV
ncbi:hypothetical protein M2M59_04070 [Rummeliibacillus sp. G93]|uniref:hypothetical protein n=1 Tax=Rummeliibacillus sp. G93 TaxID=2939494 RepID=UPI00201C6E51|nr:hypothetical protein [Rummeliibacillus sp. G93]UQW98194.1 hypothetical protein M2M59_04070 [Rummeliibacillus sp. G93]